MESCEGSLELLQHALDGANVEVDEKAEDRKGGAGHLGKMFLSASDSQVAVICHVPKDRLEVVKPKEWVESFLSVFDGKIVEESEEVVKVVLPGDKENERFPLKMRDEAINLGFAYLCKKGLFNVSSAVHRMRSPKYFSNHLCTYPKQFEVSLTPDMFT